MKTDILEFDFKWEIFHRTGTRSIAVYLDMCFRSIDHDDIHLGTLIRDNHVLFFVRCI
jgi:hypothetical protein